MESGYNIAQHGKSRGSRDEVKIILQRPLKKSHVSVPYVILQYSTGTLVPYQTRMPKCQEEMISALRFDAEVNNKCRHVR
jgi:hypothetical protein